ncbi:DNA primase [Endomicrobium proavitum]|uniref:DNA primase n=1 Tax=Endomicrobium proavitum TaxID=1408281 RepID=A0A0G3WJV1_9BACT|nr:DNA primase [Endomicrobium proavitum]AKL98165.1 DNA primase [Endomicrobium proavitum]
MAIPEDIIEKIRLSSDINAVVREYLPDLRRAGRNWKACCPFHNEKTPSFVVSPEKGIFRCFGCGAAGDVFKFVMLMDNLSWIEAVRKLAKKSGIEIQETTRDVVRRCEKTKLFEILESSATFYHSHLLKSKSASAAREYIARRGITQETIEKFRLGYAPKGQLLQSALKKGWTSEDLSKAGLITKTQSGNFFEYMSERLVFPIIDVQGRVVAFGGRTLTEQNPKYLNSPETVIYSKSSNLYGLFQTLPQLRKERRIIVLEGYMDVVIPQQFGVSGAVASLGTAFTPNHAKLIARYGDNVTLLFDSDDAGRTATQRALEILVEDGVECTVSALPEHVDADEYLNANGKEAFLKLLESSSKSAIDFMTDRVSKSIASDSSEAKAKKISLLLDFVSKSSNDIVRREWVKNISQSINVDEDAVWREFKKKKVSKYKTPKDNSNFAGTQKENKRDLSLEENLLSLVLSNRNLAQSVSAECFQDAKCQKVFGLAVSGLSDAEILHLLSQEDAQWFTALTIDAIEYRDSREILRIIIKDLENLRIEKRRQDLSQLIKQQKAGAQEIAEFAKLTKLLKGSGK